MDKQRKPELYLSTQKLEHHPVRPLLKVHMGGWIHCHKNPKPFEEKYLWPLQK